MNFHIIKKIRVLENYKIEVSFENKIKKIYDIKPLFEEFNEFKILKNQEIFRKVKIDKGGYGIFWDNQIDLSSEEIWKNGIEVK